jgi:putative tryptophan/tyrosine transport system substrate-binding protein
MIGRRDFITLLGGSAAAWPLAARAQRDATPVIGFLRNNSSQDAPLLMGFRQGLQDSGFREGQNVAIEYRSAGRQIDRLPALADDLIRQRVTVIVASGIAAARAAKAATMIIPIVFITSSDPVALGLVASLNRPGGNLTGVTTISRELGPRKLELLHEMLPSVTKVALLVNPNSATDWKVYIQDMQAAARSLGLEIIVLNATSGTDIEEAFASAVEQGASALMADIGEGFASRSGQIAELGLRHKLPTVTGTRQSITVGTVMGYGTDIRVSFRQVGTYVGRILKGDKPAELPVMQPIRFELIVNLKTAKAIGLTIPETFLLRADEVIE